MTDDQGLMGNVRFACDCDISFVIGELRGLKLFIASLSGNALIGLNFPLTRLPA
jgi:hypothetical protein